VDKIIAAAPLFAAAFFFAITPEIAAIVRLRISHSQNLGGAKVGDVKVPPHAGSAYVGDYLDYAIDLAQVCALAPLSVIGALSAIYEGLRASGTVLVLFIVMPLVVALPLFVVVKDPIEYVSRKMFGRYTRVAIVGIVANLMGGLAVVGFYKPV
jgi:hypothetical protein